MSCTNVVRSSLNFTYETLCNIKSAKKLGLLHKDYSDFLSLWYFPVLLNSDELSTFNFSQLFRLSPYSISNFFFNCEVFSSSLFPSYENFDSLSTSIFKACRTFYQKLDLTVIGLPNSLTSPLISIKTIFLSLLGFYNYMLKSYKNTLNMNSGLTHHLTKVRTNSVFFNDLTNNKENLHQARGLKFNNPVFSYDYRTGNYFPKFYQENLLFLLSTFSKITGGVRTPI